MDSLPSMQLASDIHLERMDGPVFERIIVPSADILCLVGDIGSPMLPSFSAFLKWCSERFVLVLFVCGNHEYYNNVGITVNEIDDLVEATCSRFHNVRFLNNKSIVVDGKYIFLGTTLWSFVPEEHRQSIKALSNDYKYIYKHRGVLIDVDDSCNEFLKNKAWLEKEIHAARTLPTPLVPIVLTHFTPSFHRTSHPRHDGSISKYAFSTQLSCPKGIIRLWCAGHTHYNFHHSEEGYELISNQCLARTTQMAHRRVPRRT